MDSELVLGRRLVVAVIAVVAVMQGADIASDLVRSRPADWLGAVITLVLSVFLYRGANWARWVSVAFEAILGALTLIGAGLTAAVVTSPFFVSPEDVTRLVPVAVPWGQSTVHDLLPYQAVFLVLVGLVHAGCAIALVAPTPVRAFFRRREAVPNKGIQQNARS